MYNYFLIYYTLETICFKELFLDFLTLIKSLGGSMPFVAFETTLDDSETFVPIVLSVLNHVS